MCPAVPTTMDRIVMLSDRRPPLRTCRSRRPGRCFRLLVQLRRPRWLRRGPRSPFAHALEDLDQAEIDLAHLHVDADHLHLHLVAEPVDLLRVLAAQQVRALDEPVVVVGHRRDVHHALDEVLDQLDEQAEGGDAGDVAFEFIADLVGHELHLLPLQQLALGIVGAALHLRGVARDLRQLLGPLLARLLVQRARGAPRGARDARPDRDSGGSAR